MNEKLILLTLLYLVECSDLREVSSPLLCRELDYVPNATRKSNLINMLSEEIYKREVEGWKNESAV